MNKENEKLRIENKRLMNIIEDIADTILHGDYDENVRELAIRAKQEANKEI